MAILVFFSGTETKNDAAPFSSPITLQKRVAHTWRYHATIKTFLRPSGKYAERGWIFLNYAKKINGKNTQTKTNKNIQKIPITKMTMKKYTLQPRCVMKHKKMSRSMFIDGPVSRFTVWCASRERKNARTQQMTLMGIGPITSRLKAEAYSH
eukprot:GEMP01057258.1.p1 GENE.GEMP01057258.1~~GEMP01057258.1.p1  ORF type:complete len:152 (+),score=1.38 GEMP01057258.1:360-815(+)